MPDLLQLQEESCDTAFSRYALGTFQRLGRTTGAINPYTLLLGIDEPTKFRAVSHILFHLALQGSQAITGGAKFDDKIRAKVVEAFLLFSGQSRDTILADPGTRRERAEHRSEAQKLSWNRIPCRVRQLLPKCRAAQIWNRFFLPFWDAQAA